MLPDLSGAIVNNALDFPAGISPALPEVTAAYQPDAFTPEWWLHRLYRQLIAHQLIIQVYDAYYRGDHPLPWLAPQAQESFRRILRMSRTNYMGLVCDATTERCEVLGFRVGKSPDNDKEAWRIWQANNLDSYSGDAFLEAVKTGHSFLLVAPGKEARTPRITIEHPSQVVVEYEPGDPQERSAGLKLWTDTRLNQVMATLYLPDYIYKYQGALRSQPTNWEPRYVDGEDWPLVNDLGVVPLVEIRNNPQWTYDQVYGLYYGGVSEMRDVIDIQDRINKTIADRLMTQDYGAFPQKWANNWDDEDDEPRYIVNEDDPTGPLVPAPVSDATSGPRGVDIGRDRLIKASGPVGFGTFATAPLDPYSLAKTEDVKDIASRTRTPSQYLLGEIVNVSGEALQAAESGLVSKVKQRRRPFENALEEAMRLALQLTGDNRPANSGMETIWADAEYRSEGAMVDAIVKKIQVELISKRQGREDAGYTPAQIQRMEADDLKQHQQALELASQMPPGAPSGAPGVPGAPGTPPGGPPAPPKPPPSNI